MGKRPIRVLLFMIETTSCTLFSRFQNSLRHELYIKNNLSSNNCNQINLEILVFQYMFLKILFYICLLQHPQGCCWMGKQYLILPIGKGMHGHDNKFGYSKTFSSNAGKIHISRKCFLLWSIYVMYIRNRKLLSEILFFFF